MSYNTMRGMSGRAPRSGFRRTFTELDGIGEDEEEDSDDYGGHSKIRLNVTNASCGDVGVFKSPQTHEYQPLKEEALTEAETEPEEDDNDTNVNNIPTTTVKEEVEEEEDGIGGNGGVQMTSKKDDK